MQRHRQARKRKQVHKADPGVESQNGLKRSKVVPTERLLKVPELSGFSSN